MSDADVIAALRAAVQGAEPGLLREACREYVPQFERTIQVVGVMRGSELDPGVRAGLVEAFRGWSGSSES